MMFSKYYFYISSAIGKMTIYQLDQLETFYWTGIVRTLFLFWCWVVVVDVDGYRQPSRQISGVSSL